MERSFDAPRERIYRAFTDPALRSRWLRPADDWTVPTTELDPRVGGAYRDVFRSPEGEEFSEHGRFEELREPERLVYSCRFEGGGVVEPEMRVVIDLDDAGGGKTRVRLAQTGYRSRQNRDEQEQGWPLFLDQLAKLVAAT
ncbi:MAG: SRPBCC domain-containing protein [Myxococcota bacterium]